MHVQRLLDIADLVETIPPETLEMKSFGAPKRGACGTTVCAVGYACLTPHFQKQGLTAILSYNQQPVKSIAEFNQALKDFMETEEDGDSFDLVPIARDEGHTERGWYAVEQFFGISFDQAEWLFYSYDRDVTPQAVADRIRAFVHERSWTTTVEV